jgi:hypothetical protein
LLSGHTVQFRAEVSDRESVRVIRLVGRLGREQLSELIALCGQAPKASRLELGDLISADAAGFQTLGMLRRRGTELVGASPYITMQLEFEQSNHVRALQGGGDRAGNLAAQTDKTTDTEDR